MLPALSTQSYHLRKYWRSANEMVVFGPPPVPEAWQIVIADNSDQVGALGYHDFTPGGRPISYVFAKTDLDNGYSWTVTLSHEWCEMLLDPWVSAAMQTGASRFHALELGDPVEADELGYKIGNVLVSDFVTPNWFIPGAPPIYDWKGHCTKPLQILPGGYAYTWDPANGWHGLNDSGEKQKPEDLPERVRLNLYARNRN